MEEDEDVKKKSQCLYVLTSSFGRKFFSLCGEEVVDIF